MIQTNANRENKNIAKLQDRDDFDWTDNYPMKKYSRKLRRKRQKRLLDKAIWEAMLRA